MSQFQDAVAAALASQPWYVRRKDTITSTAGLILQVLNLGIFSAGELPWWAHALIAGAIGVCQIAIHAGTPGAITPSMGPRLERFGAGRVEEAVDYALGQAMQHVERDVTPWLGTIPTKVETALPVYDLPTTGG